MTVCCETCKSPENVNCGSSPCSSHPFTVDTRRERCKRFRSTKGASKARRDQINGEIRSMRSLLPIGPEDQERLSYLHSMSVICTYIRKTVVLQGLTAGPGPECCLPYEPFLSALDGFILVLTPEGRLVYVSENVSEYLGHSMVDVLQGDSFYDMVESPDVEAVKSRLELDTSSSTERSFVCRMHTSKAFRLQHGGCSSMLVRGRYQAIPPSSPSRSSDRRVFVALCTATANRKRGSDAARSPDSFASVHKPDMAFARMSDSVVFYLGYSAEEMIGRSWYSLLHPDDLSLSACSHKNLMEADEGSQVEMVLRLQCKDLAWCWAYICATRNSGDQEISCTNYIISETEALYLRQKIHSDAFSPRVPCPSPAPQLPQAQGDCPLRGPKRQREPSGGEEEPLAKTSRGSESGVYYMTCTSLDGGSPVIASDGPAFFSTPPYSPASSHSPSHEDAGSGFLLDVYGYTEQLLSSPESSPPYYGYPEAGHPPGPGHLSPGQTRHAATEQAYDQAVFTMTVAHSPDSCPSPTYDYPACIADARLVPDCLPVPDVCESSADCALHPEDLHLPLEPQGGAVTSFPVHRVPQGVAPLRVGLLTPDPSPTSAEISFQYSEREQVEISILAQQISSLASSFDMYRTLSPVQTHPESALPPACDWPRPPASSPVLPPLKPQLVLDVDSILKDLDIVPGREAAPLSFGYQQGRGCGLEVNQRSPQEDPGLGQQPSGMSLPSLVDSLPMEQFTSSPLDPLSDLRAGCHHQHTELHQLDHYLLNSLQQDGLVEESMY